MKIEQTEHSCKNCNHWNGKKDDPYQGPCKELTRIRKKEVITYPEDGMDCNHFDKVRHIIKRKY